MPQPTVDVASDPFVALIIVVLVVLLLWKAPEGALFLAGLAMIAYAVLLIFSLRTVFQETSALTAFTGGGILVGLASIIRMIRHYGDRLVEAREPPPDPQS